MLAIGLTTIALILSVVPGTVLAQDANVAAERDAESGVAGFTAPAWLQMPNPDYPREAYRASTEGEARVQCIVNKNGLAGACQIVSETPAGMGFGEAVLAAMAAARWRPAMIDGAPVERSVQFNVPFTFLPTVKAPPEAQQVIEAIRAEGYASDACRHLLDAQLAARWDALQQEMDDSIDGYRAYDQIFVAGYKEGRQDVRERGRPQSSECDRLYDWARDAGKASQAAYQKLDAKLTLEERAQWRPLP